jgi:hypothetical protein
MIKGNGSLAIRAMGYGENDGFLPGKPVNTDIEEASNNGSHQECQDHIIHYPRLQSRKFNNSNGMLKIYHKLHNPASSPKNRLTYLDTLFCSFII